MQSQPLAPQSSSSQPQPQPPPRPPIPPPTLPPSCEPPFPPHPPHPKVWVVFGATGHLGRSVTRTALSRGDLVTAIGRNLPAEEASMHGWHVNCQGLVCDVRDPPTIKAAWDAALAHWKRVDVVVNCTGYGIIGALEDQDPDDDVRQQFETNVTGLINILQATLPYFRSTPVHQSSKRYLIFSSMHGLVSSPGLAPYCATKFAVEGLCESILPELAEHGIHLSLLEPNPLRRDEEGEGPAPLWSHFLMKRGFVMGEGGGVYKESQSPARHAVRMVDWLRYRQPGSARRVAAVAWEVAHAGRPPVRVLMGAMAVEAARERARELIEEMEEWKIVCSEEGRNIGNDAAGVIEEKRESERVGPGDAG